MLQSTFEKDDYKIICDFIISHFQEKRTFIYESGEATNEVNLAQIMQMTFELQKLIGVHKELLDERYLKFSETNRVFKKEQEKWTKKLEDYVRGQGDESGRHKDHEELPDEEKIEE